MGNILKTKPSTKEKEQVLPTDFHKVLTSHPKAKAAWNDITPVARRDFITWIEGAKQLETRKRRIKTAYDKLIRGDKRPCCYAVVPMNLYKALNGNPAAKAIWKDLTPMTRRDFVSWIDGAKDSKTHESRIDKVCSKLAAKKENSVTPS